MRTLLLISTAVAVVAGFLYTARESPARPLSATTTMFEGSWREDQVLVIRRDGRVITVHPEASLYVVSSSHYAMMATFGEPPRPRYRAFTPTDSEKLTAFDTFWGHAGRYEIVGDTILLSPTVSKNPNLMAGGHMKLVARGHGDTLWLSGDFRNYYFRVANDLVPDTLEAWRHEDIRLIRVR